MATSRKPFREGFRGRFLVGFRNVVALGFVRFQTEWNRVPRNGRDSVARQALERVPKGERGMLSAALQNRFRETVPMRFRNGAARTPLQRNGTVLISRGGPA